MVADFSNKGRYYYLVATFALPEEKSGTNKIE